MIPQMGLTPHLLTGLAIVDSEVGALLRLVPPPCAAATAQSCTFTVGCWPWLRCRHQAGEVCTRYMLAAGAEHTLLLMSRE